MTERERFERFVEPEPMSGCWLWTGGTRNGYGTFWTNGAMRKAHRESLRIYLGIVVPPELHACHKCDVKPCVNPSHLFVGTEQENQIDASRKGRSRGQKRVLCVNGHAYTPANTYMRANRPNSRDCRTCRRIGDTAERERRWASGE